MMDAIKELKEYDGYVLSEQYKIRHRVIQEIKQLRLANSDLQMHYDHARTECDKLRSEVLRLRGSLSFISMLTPLDGQSWESHARFINAYAIDQLEEEE
jgi:hypothetical protein